MSQNPVAPATDDTNRFADAFGVVALTTFAQNPSGAHLFRAQHEVLGRLMHSIIVSAERGITGEFAVAARNALTTLCTQLPMHQQLEDALVGRVLSMEPRLRMLAEQFEREMGPLLAELASFGRRYPTASSLLHAPRGEFSQAASALFTRLRDRFRREERDLFPVFDRTVQAPPAAAVAA